MSKQTSQNSSSAQGQNQAGPGPSSEGSRKRPLLNRLLLAGEVVLTSLEATAHNLIDSGTTAASSAAGHKFGPEAGHATHLLGGSVRNVAVVYIDARGIGRKALLKGTAKGFVKARLKNGETVELQGAGAAAAAGAPGQQHASMQQSVESGEVERKGENTVVVGMTQVGGPGGPFSAGPNSTGGGFARGTGAGGPPSAGPINPPQSAGGARRAGGYADQDTIKMLDRY